VKKILIIFIVVTSLLNGCSFISPHENFKNILQADIGKLATNPNILINRYPQWFYRKTILSNGNTEIEHHWGKCIYTFEIDKITNIVLKYHFKGTEKQCAITP